MVYRADKLRLKKLLMEAISLLCKNGLPVQSSFRIDATIGITLSEDEVVLVSFREVVQPDGVMIPKVDSEDEASANGVSSDNEDLNCNLEDEREPETDAADCVSSLPRTTNEGDEKTPEQNSTWTENAAFAGDSFPRILRSRKLSSKDRSSNDFLVCSDVPKTRRQIGRSFDDEPIQIKDEVVDDDDCSFVKMEDGNDYCVRTFDSLGQDDSWIHQVYNEANVYGGAGSSRLQQFSEGSGYSADGGQTGLHDASLQNISSHGSVKSLQPKRSSLAGGGFSLPGVRQNPAYSSHSQDDNVTRTLQSLCKTLADQACSSAPGESVFCHICGARLSSHATLVKHIKGTHLAMSACQCDICGQSFKWTMQLCRHRKRYHSNVLVV